ncbi:MAG: cellulose biosynthesis protein BcsS [Parvibaculaceae bacterium]
MLGGSRGRGWRDRLGNGLAGLIVVCGANGAVAGEGFSVSGGGGTLEGFDTFQGVLYAPWSALGESGFQVRGWAKSYLFEYETSLPNDPGARIQAMGYGFQVELGWQFAGDWGHLAGFVGPAWRDHELQPPDPGSSLDRARLGVAFTLDGEWRALPDLGVMVNASYVTGVDQHWAQVKPFLELGDGFRTGLSLAVFGGPDYEKARLGLFASGYELEFITWRRTFIGGELGVQSDFSGRGITPYVGLHSGFLF